MSDNAPIKIDLKITLTMPEVKMCDCGHNPPHAFMTIGPFKSTPFGSRAWGRKIVQIEEIDFFGESVLEELKRQIEQLPLPEEGPEKVRCSQYANQKIIIGSQDDSGSGGENN